MDVYNTVVGWFLIIFGFFGSFLSITKSFNLISLLLMGIPPMMCLIHGISILYKFWLPINKKTKQAQTKAEEE